MKQLIRATPYGPPPSPYALCSVEVEMTGQAIADLREGIVGVFRLSPATEGRWQMTVERVHPAVTGETFE